MHFLIEISYDPPAADALRTLAMEAGEKFSKIISGKKSSGLKVKGCWMALEGCAAYLIIESADGLRSMNSVARSPGVPPGSRPESFR
jgi:hypothetical protein